MFENEEILALSGLKYEGEYFGGDAFSKNRLDEDLANGKRVIISTTDKTFAVSGHYMSIVGKTEDGKYILRDSDSANWSKYEEQYENEFSLEFLKAHINGGFYAFSVEPTETTKDDDTLVKEILEESGDKTENGIEKVEQASGVEPTTEGQPTQKNE